MTEKKIGRDAKTGEFISVAEANRRPATSIVETIQQTSSKNITERGRDAKTGEFISVSEAKRRPSTTLMQNIRTTKRR